MIFPPGDAVEKILKLRKDFRRVQSGGTRFRYEIDVPAPAKAPAVSSKVFPGKPLDPVSPDSFSHSLGDGNTEAVGTLVGRREDDQKKRGVQSPADPGQPEKLRALPDSVRLGKPHTAKISVTRFNTSSWAVPRTARSSQSARPTIVFFLSHAFG
jgi:hypothetical protein